ncbi:LysR family transcriptional regulator [Pusillimonas sp. SM2304]|uniref:LysR family transcriptional regulator n=1 Tax=Pusillimonas sp. SM2304 TaxID=3073241 RepID=UPI0028740960|nr:LysR family transcriptional regulator [Pusillimonas sp. SM2304]MDS1138815.1 LysR family transcriptional regulator [Pusillimonas sp. SM2304]
MNILECIDVFVEVAKGLNFSKAAERLGTSRSAVTKKVAWLENHFGAQLLNRNTKTVSLTESGRLLLENADSVTQSLKALQDLVRNPVQTASGRIRIGSPPSFGAVHLTPAIGAFLSKYPKIKASLLIDDGRSDLIAENMDLSVRIAPRLKDTNQIAYKIAVVPQALVATQAYIEQHGLPQTPKDLEQHNCLVHSLKAPTGSWTFRGQNGEMHVARVSGSFDSNLGESILHMAKLDHGIAMHPRYMVEKQLKSKSVEIVLPDYMPEGLDIYAIVQSKKHLPYKVRLFVNHLREWFKDTDWSV